MALIGGGLGGMDASKLASRKKNDQTLAPGPAVQPTALAPPTPPIVNPSDINAQALTAAQKVRKRAAQGVGLGSTPPPASGLVPPPRLQPRSLISS